MEKKRIHVNGIDLVYEECGHGDKKALVLLHGFCGSSYYWRKICGQLNDEHRIIIPNLRGHGGSGSSGGNYSMELLAKDIAELLNALGVEKVILFGHSLGGYVAAAFAELYPDRVSGLSLIHSTVLPDSESTRKQRVKDIAAIQAGGMNAYLRKLVPQLFGSGNHDDMQAELEALIHNGQQVSAEAAIATIEGMMNRRDRSHVLARAEFPVLLIAGSEDSVVKPDDSFTLTNLFESRKTYSYPHILETTFEGVAHMSLIEISDQLARVMQTYVQTLDEREEKRSTVKDAAEASEASNTSPA
jgi:3-oxoadipate enol-lactonase